MAHTLPTARQLRRNARRDLVTWGLSAAQIATWLEHGGNFTVVGDEHSGRDLCMEGIAGALEERGNNWVRIPAGRTAWSGITSALADPCISTPAADLPIRPTREHQIEAAAAQLTRRSTGPLFVIADDLEHLDHDTLSVLGRLAQTPQVHICVGGQAPPPWADETCLMAPINAQAMQAMLTRIMGAPIEVPQFLEGGPIGQIISLLAEALRCQAFVPSGEGWAVKGHVTPGPTDTRLLPNTRTVLQVVALAETPLPVQTVLESCDPPAEMTSLELLVTEGWVRANQNLVWVPPRLRAKALDLRVRPQHKVHSAIVQQLVKEEKPPWSILAHHIASSGSPELVDAHGHKAIDRLAFRDAHEAANIAEKMLGVTQTPRLVCAAIDALKRAGRIPDAKVLGQQLLKIEQAENWEASEENRKDAATVLALLARIEIDHGGNQETIEQLLEEANKRLKGDTPAIEVLDARARLFAASKRHGLALATAQEGAELPPPDLIRQRDLWIGMRLFLARGLSDRGDKRKAMKVLRAQPPGPNEAGRAVLETERGKMLWEGGEFLEGARAYGTATRATPEANELDQIRWMDQAGIALYRKGDRANAITGWVEAVGLAEQSGRRLERIRILINLCTVQREVGHNEAARRSGQAAFAAAAEARAANYQATAAINLGDVEMATNAWADADAWFARAQAIAKAHDMQRVLAKLHRRAADLAMRQESGEAAALARRAIDACNAMGMIRDVCRANALLAVARSRTGDARGVDEALRNAFTPLRQTGDARVLAELRLSAAQAFATMSRVEDALEMLSKVVVWADEVGHVLFRERADSLGAEIRSLSSQTIDTINDDRIHQLLDLAVALARQRNSETLLDSIAESALELVAGERAFVILERRHSPDHNISHTGDQRLEVVAARSRDGTIPSGLSMSTVTKAIARGREVIVDDVSERKDMFAADSVMNLNLRSVMCVPLFDGETTLGALYVDSTHTSHQKLSEAVQFMRALAAHAAVAVTNARLLSERAGRAQHAAEVAHDIRSPVAAVLMAADDMRQTDGLEKWMDESLGEVMSLSRRVINLVEGILEVRPGKSTNVDLVERTEELVMLAARDARRRGKTVVFGPGPSQAWVAAVPDELDRVLNNLLANSIKFTKPATAVRVSLETTEKTVTWKLQDAGPGIDAEIQETLFQTGVKGNADVPGHGIGLAIAKRIAEEHGGTLSAETPPGGGAIFSLTLPLIEPPQRSEDL